MFDQAFSDWFSSALSSGNSVDRSVVVLAEDDPLEVERDLRDLAKIRRQYRRRSLRARTFPCGPTWNSRTPSTPLRAGSPTTRSTRQTISSVASMRCAPTTTAPSPATWTSMRCGECTCPPCISAMKWKSFEFEAYQRLGPWKKAQGEEEGARLHGEALALDEFVGSNLLALLAHVGSLMIGSYWVRCNRRSTRTAR